jgi:F420-non-reducing hydrogenase iron-sulfur subunit
MCSGRVDPQLVINAFKENAEGIMVLGCHPGECHYKEGNYHALRRYILLKEMVAQFGIEEGRLRLHWVSASEGDKFVKIVSEMVRDLKELGPLSLRDMK